MIMTVISLLVAFDAGWKRFSTSLSSPTYHVNHISVCVYFPDEFNINPITTLFIATKQVSIFLGCLYIIVIVFQCSDYTVRKLVTEYNIPYFVKVHVIVRHLVLNLTLHLFAQVSFDERDLPNIEREVVEVYIWELKEQCRYDKYWGIGK